MHIVSSRICQAKKNESELANSEFLALRYNLECPFLRWCGEIQE